MDPETNPAEVPRRTLGRSEVSVPVVVFGAWAIGGGYWGATDDEAAIAAMRLALDLGIDAIDTAPIYGLGHSERLVGAAIRGRREEVRILTKVGLRWDDDRGAPAFTGTRDDGSPLAVFKNSRPDSVRLEVGRSLERLGTSYLDLVQVHWPDPTTPIAATMGALAELVREGVVRAVGVSNYTVPMLAEAQRALGDVPLASDQPKYSLVDRSVEADVLPWCHAHGVGVLCYSPLEQGLLAGAVPAERAFGDDEGRSRRTTFQPENRRRVNALVDAELRPVAAAHDATPAQVALAWLLARPGVTAVLSGARRPDQVRENVGAARLRLAAEELERLDRAFGGLELVGA